MFSLWATGLETLPPGSFVPMMSYDPVFSDLITSCYKVRFFDIATIYKHISFSLLIDLIVKRTKIVP